MASCHEASLVSPIVLDIIDHMAGNFGVSLGYGNSQSQRLERIVGDDLFSFELFRRSPLVIAVLLVNKHRFVVVSWNLLPILVYGMISEVLEMDLIDGTSKDLAITEKPLTMVPPVSVQ